MPQKTDLDPSTQERLKAVKLGFSLDGWAVVIAIAAALVIRFVHALPAVPWFK